MNLCELVTDVTDRIAASLKQRVAITNQVDPGLHVDIDKAAFSHIMQLLLEDAATNSAGPAIKIWAKQFHDLAVIHLKFKDSRSEDAIDKKLAAAETMAEQMGGCLYISNTLISGTTIAFTFLTKKKSIAPASNISSYPAQLHPDIRLSA